MSIKQLILAVGILAASAATAVDDTFPNKDGSGNLLSEDAWGGPVSQNRMKIGAGGTYYADPNGTINGIVIGTTGKVIFDQTKSTQENPLVTLGGGFDIGGKGRNVTFKGGKYDFQNLYTLTYGGYDSYNNNTVLFDGCVITNTKSVLSMTYNGTTLTTWTLTNNAVLHTKGDLKPDYFGNGKTHLYITGGSSVLAEGILKMGVRNDGNVGSVDQKIFVAGAGSQLRFGKKDNASYLSVQFSDCLLDVSDGGSVVHSSNKEFSLGAYTSASNNVIRVRDAGSTANLGTVNFGYTSAASHNRVEALDGANVAISYVGLKDGLDNGFVCSNATITVNNFSQTSATNSYLHVSGDHPHVTLAAANATQQNFKRGFRFIVDLPPNGYTYEDAADCPIKANGQIDGLDATTEFEINGIEEYQKQMIERRIRKAKIKLAYFNSNAYWGQLNTSELKLLDKWNARLPEGAVLSSPNAAAASDRGRTLYLNLEVKLGMMLIFR